MHVALVGSEVGEVEEDEVLLLDSGAHDGGLGVDDHEDLGQLAGHLVASEVAHDDRQAREVKWQEVVEALLEAGKVALDLDVHAVAVHAHQRVVAHHLKVVRLRQVELPLLVKFLPQEVAAIRLILKDKGSLSLVRIDLVVVDSLVAHLHFQRDFFFLHLQEIHEAFLDANNKDVADHLHNRVIGVQSHLF